MKLYNDIPVFGEMNDQGALDQITEIMKTAEYTALMADHHLGYSMPIGGVAAYDGLVSPSGVGYDIACGNKAVKLDIPAEAVVGGIEHIMDRVFSEISFGVGRNNKEDVDHALFYDDPAWDIPVAGDLKEMARAQLGTIGSGNHYVDIFVDQDDAIWVGCHFGSRGLGHKLATHFVKEGGGKDDINAAPVLLEANSTLGKEYIACMELAGRYAYAGRDWVCNKVASILGGVITDEVHNHHNFAWNENHYGKDLWVVRKGATPCFPNQRGFIGGSMGDYSYIIQGRDQAHMGEVHPDAIASLFSTVHGAGRVMSRSKAAGKKRWKKGKLIVKSEGCITRQMMNDWINPMGVCLRGAGTDESPHCYKRIDEVLGYHSNTLDITHKLKPIGVAMAGANEFDPYKD